MSVGRHFSLTGWSLFTVNAWTRPIPPQPSCDRMIFALATQEIVSFSGSRNASTASRGSLPGKGDQHGDPSDRRIAGSFVVPGVPLGQELLP